MEKHTVSRLIGAPPGYVGFDQGGLLTDGVDQHPHCVLLLDEMEKAHPDVYNILLQVMDNGKLTDHNGRTVDFRNVVLIMTSNAGAMEQAQNALGFGRSRREGEDTAAVEQQVHAAVPQPARRGDQLLGAAEGGDPAGGGEVRAAARGAVMDRNVQIELSSEAAEWLADRGYDDKMGARPPGDPGAHQEAAGGGAPLRQARQGRHRAGPGAERRDRLEDRAGRHAADHREEAAAAEEVARSALRMASSP